MSDAPQNPTPNPEPPPPPDTVAVARRTLGGDAGRLCLLPAPAAAWLPDAGEGHTLQLLVTDGVALADLVAAWPEASFAILPTPDGHVELVIKAAPDAVEILARAVLPASAPESPPAPQAPPVPSPIVGYDLEVEEVHADGSRVPRTLRVLLALAVLVVPSLAFAQDAGLAAPPVIGPAQVQGAIAAAGAHDWQAIAAVLLPLLAWAMRRFASPTRWAHTPLGAGIITGALACVGALAPVLDSHHFTIQSAISAVTVALLALAGMSNPSVPRPLDGPPLDKTPQPAPPPGPLVGPLGPSLILLAALSLTGCHTPGAVAFAGEMKACEAQSIGIDVSKLAPDAVALLSGCTDSLDACKAKLAALASTDGLAVGERALSCLVDAVIAAVEAELAPPPKPAPAEAPAPIPPPLTRSTQLRAARDTAMLLRVNLRATP